jgi:hypothetical protein
VGEGANLTLTFESMLFFIYTKIIFKWAKELFIFGYVFSKNTFLAEGLLSLMYLENARY